MYKLLVVEDEPLIRQGIVSLINFVEMEIEQVFEAADGQQGLKIVEKEQPDIILTDINLPYLDGLTFAKKVKLLFPQTVIVFLTGYDYFDYALTALKLGADDYLLKPVTKQEVEELLVKAVTKLKTMQKVQKLTAVMAKQEQIVKEIDPSLSLKKIIDQQLANPLLSLVGLADELGFNASYLSGLIKKKLGVPFQDYVATARIEQAKVLLLATSLKHYEIAEKVGFEDVNYFSLRFKQITGLSPRQYKKEAERQ